MKKTAKLVTAILCSAVLLSACGKEDAAETSSVFEPIESTEGSQEAAPQEASAQEENQPEEASSEADQPAEVQSETAPSEQAAQADDAAPVTYEDADGFMGSFLLSSDRDKIDTTDEYGVFYRVVYQTSLEGDELTACGSMDYRNDKDQDPITITSDETHIFKVDDSTVYVMDGAESGRNEVSKEEFADLLNNLKDSGVFFEVEISGGVVKTATIIS